jgi:hypothetical protein
MFVHVVLFWLSQDTPAAARQQMRKDAVDSLKNIPTVKHVFAGIPANTPRDVVDNSYDLGLTVIFENSADHDAYQVHPIHKQYIANYGKYWSKIQAFDFQ